MTAVSVRQVKNKDGEIVSDVNGALRVLKKRMMKRWVLSNTKREKSFLRVKVRKNEKQDWTLVVDVG